MQNYPVFRAQDSKQLTDYLPEYNTNNFPLIHSLKSQMEGVTLIIVHQDQYVCTDVFLITEGSGARLPYLQGHHIFQSIQYLLQSNSAITSWKGLNIFCCYKQMLL
jgi:hypothetical protein